MTAFALKPEDILDSLLSLHPVKIDLSLGRILRLLDALGRPQDQLPPVIHIAGTNAKGSVTAFMRAIAEAAGLSVHVATSPHLVCFNERIRLAGELISDSALIEVLEHVRTINNGQPITHFEASMAATLYAFSQSSADLVLLEVGLGGRYDATNVIDQPALSVITPIDYDHKEYLGDNLPQIAYEKAGIIKSGCPVISAEQAPEVVQVLRQEADKQDADLHIFHEVAQVKSQGETLRYIGQTMTSKAIIPGLYGTHQHANAGLAAVAMEIWGHPAITLNAIETGIRQVSWPARLQIMANGPLKAQAPDATLWLDGGHNPHASRALAGWFAKKSGKLGLITAMMARKDAKGFFAPFCTLNPDIITLDLGPAHNGYQADALAGIAKELGLQAQPGQNLGQAVAKLANAGAEHILICGSLYQAGAALHTNHELVT